MGRERAIVFRKSITWPKLLKGNERLSIKELYWAAETTKDRMDANDSYESSEMHSLQGYGIDWCISVSWGFKERLDDMHAANYFLNH